MTLPEGTTASFAPGARRDVTLNGAAQEGAFEVGSGTHAIGFATT